MKIFRYKAIWLLFAIYFGIWTAITIVGGSIAYDYREYIDAMFGLESYKYEQDEVDEEIDTKYFKSAFVTASGEFDSQALWEHSVEIAEKAQAEGTTILWNSDSQGNKGVPLGEGAKVSTFGKTSGTTKNASEGFIYSGGGSGRAFADHEIYEDTPTVYSALTDAGLSVNKTLFDWYSAQVQGDYKSRTASAVNEIPWSLVSGQSSSFAQYNDAAIVFLGRYGGENGQLAMTGADTIGGDYLELHKNERDEIEQLIALKKAGTFKKVIVLLNTPTGINFDLLKEYRDDINACIWIGQPGYVGLNAIGDILSGKNGVQAGGRLADTFAYLSKSNPSTENAQQSYTNLGEYGYVANELSKDSDFQSSYIVYAENIYVGYKYFETRYEDAVLSQGNATSNVGVKNSAYNSWVYSQEVAFPFGYGEKYTTFEYSEFVATKQQDGSYEVSVKVSNVGDVASSDVVQVYLQKPYTEYDKQMGIEQSAVNLCGYARTDVIEPGASQTVKATVKAEAFRTYDAYGHKTYILEAGDYYLAVGSNAHDAVNNVLAKKGKTPANTSNVMDAEGNADVVELIQVENTDTTIFAKSPTNYDITNRFDHADWNLYKSDSQAGVTYLSRKDWQATYPVTPAKLTLTQDIVNDFKTNRDFEETETTYPSYNKKNGIMLVSLMGKDYNDPMWEKFLDQLSPTQTAELLHGFNGPLALPTLGKPKDQAHDGPLGCRGTYKGKVNGKSHRGMAFPCAAIIASTYDNELIKLVGDAKGEGLLHMGLSGLYGTGNNIHRTPYLGRCYEYYSEDGYLSGQMTLMETLGIQGNNLKGQPKGTYVTLKHMVLNESEHQRFGICTYVNEQAMREIYLEANEPAVVEGKARSIMSSFNRVGPYWSGGDYNLMTEVLRNEWGFDGFVVSDGNRRDYMGAVDALICGNDFILNSDAAITTEIENYIKSSPTLAQRARDCAHRMLYGTVRSSVMNGLSANTRIIELRGWWQDALVAVQCVFGVITACLTAMFVLCFVYGTPAKQAEFAQKKQERFAVQVEKYGSVEKATFIVNRNKWIAIGSVSMAIVIALTSVITPTVLRMTATPKIFPMTGIIIEAGAEKAYAGEELSDKYIAVHGVYGDDRMKTIDVGTEGLTFTYYDASDKVVDLGASGKLSDNIKKVKATYNGFEATYPFEVRPEKKVFEAEDAIVWSSQGHVGTAAITTASGGVYVNNLSYAAPGQATVTYYLHSSEKAEAELFITLADPYRASYYLDNLFSMTLNGKSFEHYNHKYPNGGSVSTRWNPQFVAAITLEKGINKLVFTKTTEEGKGSHFDCISISSTATVTSAITKLEAESSTPSRSVTIIEKPTASGGKAITNVYKNATNFTFEFDSSIATSAELFITHARSTVDTTLAQMIKSVTVNGTTYTVGTDYPDETYMASSAAAYYRFRETKLVDIVLQQGKNVITIEYPGASNVNFLNFDCLKMVMAGKVKTLTDFTLEAENAVIVAEQVTTGTENKTQTAVNNPSGGAFVYGIGAKVATFTFTFQAEEVGKAQVYLRMGSYGTTSDKTRMLSKVFNKLTINGTELTVGNQAQDHAFVGVGAGKYFIWTNVFVYEMDVVVGTNTIIIHKPANSDWINFDSIVLKSDVSLSVAE